MDRYTKTVDVPTIDKLPGLKKPGSRDSQSIKEFNTISRTGSQGFPRLGREVNNYMSEDFEAAEKRQGFSREVSKGISYLDVVSRVRDLERKYIDLASSMDRRLQTFIEETPQKVLRHLKGIEDKETTFRKENQNKQIALQENFDYFKGSVKDNQEIINQVLNTLTRRLDDSEFKIVAIMKNLESANIYKSHERLLAIADKPVEQEQKLGGLEAEVRLLKEALNQERQRRDVLFQDIMQQYQEINNYVHQNENALLGKIRKHKEEVFEENKRTKEQQKKLEEIKLEKLLGDSEYIKALIRKVETKIEDEVNKRLKHEFENKNWMEQKMTILKQEIKADEKDLLENEKKFLQNIQESMNSLSQIVTNTREQLEANLASTQTLFNENVKSLSKTVDLVKNHVYTKLNVLDTTVKDIDQRVVETQKNLHEHTITVNQTLDKEFTRIEKVTLKFEEVMNDNFKVQDEKIAIMEENNKLWKKNFEDKNLKILTEISNALKTLKGDLNKEKIATAERFENVKKEISSNQTAVEKLVEQLNDRIKGVEAQFDYKLDETYVRVTEDIRVAIESLSKDSTKVGASALDKAKNDSQANITALDQKLKKYTDLEIAKVKEEAEKNTRNAAEGVKAEISKEIQSVYLKLADLQRQKGIDNQEIQNELKLLHERINETGDESREKLRQISDEFDGKIKLAYQNARAHATDKVRDLKEEMDKAFNSQNNYIRKEIDFASKQGEKLVNDMGEKIKLEIQSEKIDTLKKVEDLLEEERKARAAKDTEIINSIQSVKNMLLESINTKIESTQALIRALVNEETAERARSIENLTTTFKKRLDALEKFFKDLISTSIEETKLELKELIRNLEIKVEEQRVWTIKELNLIVKDLEEYIIVQTAKEYREELFSQVLDNDRAEQWKQIQDAFQVVGSKFEEMDFIRKGDFEQIYARLQEIALFIGNQDKNIKEIEKNVEDTQENIYVMDEKFSNRIEDLDLKGQVRDYVDFLYNKVESKQNNEDGEDLRKDVKRKFNKVYDQLNLIGERFNEDEKNLELFEQKTENNFKIAEKALLAHRDFINNVDSRLTMEEMVNRIAMKNLEERFALELATVNTQVDLVNDDLEARFDKKLDKYKKHLEEDVIPHQTLKLEEKLTQVKNDTTNGAVQDKEYYQKKISEHEALLLQHKEALEQYNQRMSQNSQSLDQAKKDLVSEIDKRDAVNKEQAATLTKKMDELNKKLEELQKGGISDSIKDSIKTLIMKDVQKTLDNDVQSLMEKNMQIMIEKDISKLVERETIKTAKPLIDQETTNNNAKLKELEAKIAKGGAGGGVQDEEVKKELAKFKELIEKVQKELIEKDKANGAVEKKIENLSTNVANIEKTVKNELDKTYNSQNDNHKAVTNQLSKLFDQFQTLQQKLEKK